MARIFLAIPLILTVMAVVPAEGLAAAAAAALAMVTPEGTVSIQDGSVVPPFPKAGRWTELAGKASDRYDTRRFFYLVPNESPAIELYVVTDRRNGTPDGAFEIGLFRGYLTSFAAKAGLSLQDSIVFQERVLGQARVKCAVAKLSDARRTLWVHAYIYPRQPSLTFIAIRAHDGGQEGIEQYLATIRVK